MNTTGIEEIPGLTQGVQRCESEIALTGRNLVRSGLVDSNKEKPIPSQSHHICIVSYDINLHSVVLWIFYISYHIMIFLIGPCLSNSIILMTHSATDWVVQGIWLNTFLIDRSHVTTAIWWPLGVAVVSVTCMRLRWVSHTWKYT